MGWSCSLPAIHPPHLSDIAEVEQEVGRVVKAALHVEAGDDHLRAEAAPGQVAGDAHLEEVEGDVPAALIDSQLAPNL